MNSARNSLYVYRSTMNTVIIRPTRTKQRHLRCTCNGFTAMTPSLDNMELRSVISYTSGVIVTAYDVMTPSPGPPLCK
jgi:hypothetical protein